MIDPLEEKVCLFLLIKPKRVSSNSMMFKAPKAHLVELTKGICFVQDSEHGWLAELETFLGRLDPDYGQYASAMWQNGVRTAHQLANADKENLVAAGVTSAIHAKDIKARAGPQG